MARNRCNEKDISQRGNSHPQQTELLNTQATYALSGSAGDNVIQDLPCDSSVYIGAVVRMSGSTVVNALADSRANSNVIGICVSKSSSTLCNVQVIGFTDSIFSSLDVTKNYFLSDTVAGAITTTIPTTAGHVVLNLGKPLSSSKFILQPKTRLVRS